MHSNFTLEDFAYVLVRRNYVLWLIQNMVNINTEYSRKLSTMTHFYSILEYISIDLFHF